MSIARAKKIRLLLFDVDGVATDGKIWVFPLPNGSADGDTLLTQTAIEPKGFHAHDGIGVSLAKLAGLKVGLITKRVSATVAIRARALHLDHVLQGISDKRAAFEEVLAKEGLRPEEAAYIGDDVIDLPVMRICGLAFSVPNGRAEAKREAHVITDHAGGEGALRDAIEYILRAQGQLEATIETYLNASHAAVDSGQ